MPAYAVGHGFPWGSEEGFDIDIENEKAVLYVPEKYRNRLNQKIYLYKFSGENFELLEDVTPLGHNFISYASLKPISCEEYSSVEEGMKANGGIVKFIK
jgi:hypothetical protein